MICFGWTASKGTLIHSCFGDDYETQRLLAESAFEVELAQASQPRYIDHVKTTTVEPLPPEVGQLGNFEARMRRNLHAVLEDWDEVCSALGPWEAAHLADDHSSTARAQHRAWVTNLLSWGQMMERVTEHSGFSDRAAAARVNARLRHLQDKLDLWHGDMTAEEEERIMRSAFA